MHTKRIAAPQFAWNAVNDGVFRPFRIDFEKVAASDAVFLEEVGDRKAGHSHDSFDGVPVDGVEGPGRRVRGDVKLLFPCLIRHR